MNKTFVRWSIAFIVVASVLTSAIYYPFAPDRVASHGNAAGQVDGYMSRFWGLTLFPLMQVGLALLLLGLPRIDRLRANIAQFRTHYDRFIAVFLLYLLGVQLVVVAWNAGAALDFNVIIPLGAGMVFFYIGTMLSHLKRNGFIGVRTPWTISNDEVWTKTHQLSARLFMGSGVFGVVGVFFGSWAWLFVVVPVGLSALYAVAYSYFAYRAIERTDSR